MIGRIGKDTLWFKGRLNTADSTDLAVIAASGTSAWEIACILLSSVYTESQCSGFGQNQYFLTAKRSMDSVVTVSYTDPDLAYLGQSVPNPASEQTTIPYQLTMNVKEASIVINDLLLGRKAAKYNLNPEIKNTNLTINLSEYATGVYSYSLMIDGTLIDTKKMVVIK